MATRYTIGAGAVTDVSKWDGGTAVPVAGDIVQIRHAMTIGTGLTFPNVGTDPFASLDLAAAGGTNPRLTVTGDVTIRTPILTGLNMLYTAAAGDLTITGGTSPAVTATTARNQGWLVCEGGDIVFGTGSTMTVGGSTCPDQGIIIGEDATLTVATLSGTSADNFGVQNSGTLNANVTGVSNTASGVRNDGTITGNVVGRVIGNAVGPAVYGVENPATIIGNVEGYGRGTALGVECALAITGTVLGVATEAPGVLVWGTQTGNVIGISGSSYGVYVSGGTVVADSIQATSASAVAFKADTMDETPPTLTESTGSHGVELTVRRLDGGQAIEMDTGTVISDTLKVTYVSNPTAPLMV